MKIEPNSVVAIHYTLTGEDGEVIDSSEGADALVYLSGAHNIIPGLDNALLGHEAGDTKKVVVQPDEGYGNYDENLVQAIPREMFGGIEDIEVGMSFQAEGPEGQTQFVEVMKIEGEEVTVDGNHVLAGKVLNFDVKIESVREATEEEISHGHVH